MIPRAHARKSNLLPPTDFLNIRPRLRRSQHEEFRVPRISTRRGKFYCVGIDVGEWRSTLSEFDLEIRTLFRSSSRLATPFKFPCNFPSPILRRNREDIAHKRCFANAQVSVVSGFLPGVRNNVVNVFRVSQIRWSFVESTVYRQSSGEIVFCSNICTWSFRKFYRMLMTA